MLKLIRLEWKKNHIARYIRNALIVAGVLGLFLFATAYFGIANDPDTGVPDTAEGYNFMSASVEMVTGVTFLIFTSLMLASFIVSAYKNKTMNLMFSYPIKRRNILISQMLAVWIFNFVALVLTKLLIYGCILAGSAYKASAFPIDYDMTHLSFYAQLVLKSVVTVSVSFIALFVGLVLRSSKATIVTSFLLILLTQANIGDYTLANRPLFPLVLIALSLVFAFLSIRNVETKDLI
ncbi:ABC transporter permease [Gorillibacterium timonense]|uniref:ABC transporter permease n=1 Tax=Gorillibacterium timonense TaxID=1689269 RepID=UPI00071C8C72|nr:ABC transporter permease [Gorillibacterium timonense]